MSQYLNLKPVEFEKLSAKRKAAVKWPGRLMLPKYDGCLAIVCFWNGALDFIVSRSGETVKSMAHIGEDIAVRYPWVADTKGGLAFIGEAWSPGKTFAELSGMFRRHSPQLSLGFAPFDLVPFKMGGELPELHSTDSYERRLIQLQDSRHVNCLVHPPSPVICEDEAHAHRYAANLKALGGYDGAVVSDPGAAYVVSDGHGEFLKIKPLRSFSLRVTGVAAGVGDKTGRATVALQVAFKGGTCGVGTGFDNASSAQWAADPSLVVGRIAEVSCMDVYPGEQGMMREPRFLGWRDDVTTPDF